MERIDCEKCLNSHFEGEKIRCRLKKCQPDYEDMREARKALLECFPNSFVNDNGEFIADLRTNSYFILHNCETPLDIECKVLEWLSRPASKGIPYSQEWRNRKFRNSMRKAINSFLDTGFSESEMETIYTYLGNACNHEKTIAFIESGYDFSVLN